MTIRVPKRTGRVSLVGAGPGDVGLITARGLECLSQADVVVYDRLANRKLLDHAPAGAEKISVSDTDTGRKRQQDEINQILLRKAQAGCQVVRLKGGDPYLFGRGAEEVTFLGRNGIACEVVPGITAGLAAPMAAGIALTRRDVASTVVLVTGHEDAEKPEASIDYRSLGGLIESGGTACFYMAVGRIRSVVQQLRRHHVGADTPVAVVQWGFTPRQRSVRTTLEHAVAEIERSGLGSPSIIVIGQVCGVTEPAMEFYTARPLFGRRVVITRTRQQASQLCRMLSDLGAEVLEAPVIELVRPDDLGPVDEALRSLNQFDWLILTSVNGVEALAQRLDQHGLDARHLASVRIASIGDATADALRRHLAVRADVVPDGFVAEALAQKLIADGAIKGQRVLLLRADIARPRLPQLLREAGADVQDLSIYETHRAATMPGPVLDGLRHGDIDWIAFTSSSTARYTVEILGEQAHLLRQTKAATIGPITSATLRELGFEPAVEADPFNLEGLVQAMVEKERGAGRQAGAPNGHAV